MPENEAYNDAELEALADDDGDYTVTVGDEDIYEARATIDDVSDMANDLTDEEAAEILSQFSDEEIAALDEHLTEMGAVALSDTAEEIMLSEEDDYDDAYMFDEPDEGSLDGLTLAQLGGVISAKESVDALARVCGDDEMAYALSETSAMLEDVLNGAQLSTLLSESADPAVVMLAEQFMQNRQEQDQQAMMLAEGQVDELVDVLLCDDATGEATITPQQAAAAREILLTAPPSIRMLFCEFLQNAPAVMSFDEYGTAYADPEDLPVHHPGSATMQIISLAEDFEEHGYSSDDALRMARMRLYGE